MGRNALPLQIQQLKGADKKDPARYRDRVAAVPRNAAPLGEPPAHLSPSETVAWNELASMFAANVTCSADRWAVEIASCLMAKRRDNPDKFKAADAQLLVSLLSRFGMTPADRSKVSAPPDDAADRNEFAEFDDLTGIQ
jgi:phage terminase small subunit